MSRAGILDRLGAAIHGGCAAAPDAPGLLSVTVRADGVAAARLPALAEPVFHFSRPGVGFALLGLGKVAAVEARGMRRFAETRQAYGRLAQGWVRLDPEGTGHLPVALGGFAFDPVQHPALGGALPNTQLLVPELLLRAEAGCTSLTVTLNRARQRLAGAAADRMAAAERLLAALECASGAPGRPCFLARRECLPPDAEWLGRVADAVAAIRAGSLQKVVLTRRLSVTAARPFDPGAVLGTLARTHADCTHFAVGDPAGGFWLGATPESLVALRAGEVSSDALAGTAERGADAADDRRLAQALAMSAKAEAEHRPVVEALRSALEPLCSPLAARARPLLRQLPHLQHLWTPVRGRVRPGVTLLDLLERVHPTPAVGGMPRQRALEWLRARGEVRGGWYTGGIGWIDCAGEGEFAVVLRCAYLRGAHGELYAGAGIVADSDPARELEETEMKSLAMLEALGGVRGLRAADAGHGH